MEGRARCLDHLPTAVKLLSWLRSRGWVPEKALRLAEFPRTGRGLMCAEAVAAGDVVASLPLEAMITREKVLESGVASLFRGDCLPRADHLSSQELLSVFLLRERRRGQSSPWRPYLDTLPETHQVLYFCTPAEVECLPPHLREEVREQRRQIGQVHSRLQRACRGDFPFTRGELEWAWFAVNTRSVYFSGEEGKGEGESGEAPREGDRLALAPLLDMFNHSPLASVTAGVDLRGAGGGRSVYQIVVNAPVSRHREVFINYGPHDNVRLALEYGFAVPGNPHDSVPLTLQELSGRTKAPPAAAALDVVERAGLAEKMGVTSAGLSWSALACLHVLLLEDGQLSKWHEVYGCEDLEDGHSSLARAVIADKLSELDRSLTELNDLPSRSDSGRVALDLMAIHVETLEAALRATSLREECKT